MTKPRAYDLIAEGLEEVYADIEKNPPKPSAPPFVPLTVDQFEWAGELLYGRNWKTEMAEVMGWKDSARVRAMIRASRPIPKGAGHDLVAQLKSRAEACLELVKEIEAGAAKQLAAE